MRVFNTNSQPIKKFNCKHGFVNGFLGNLVFPII